MEKEIEQPLIVRKDYDNNNDNIEINIHRLPQEPQIPQVSFEKFYLNNQTPPHNSKKITKIVCSSDANYVVTFSEEDKSIYGWPINDDDDDDDDDEIIEELLLHYNAKFQKNELKDLLMVSNDRYVLIRISGKEQDEFRIVKLDEKENEIFYVKGDPACDQGTFISTSNDFFIIYKKELEAYIYCTSRTVVSKREMDKEHNKDITTIWQLKSKHKFVFPQQFWKKEETRPQLGCFLTPEKIFLTYKGSNILSQWDLFTMTFEKQYLLELNKRNIHPNIKVEDNIFEVKQSIVVDGTKSSIVAIHGYSTFNYEHQILVYNMQTELRISSYSMPSENSTMNISVVGMSEDDGGVLIYGCEDNKPVYYLHDLYDLDFCENAEKFSKILPDRVDAQLVVNKKIRDKIVVAKDDKLLVFNIKTEELKRLRDKLKLKKLIKDQSDQTYKYYPYPYPSGILTTLLNMLGNLDWHRSADLPAEYTSKELGSIKWHVNHWKKTGRTLIKVSELTSNDEWNDLDEFKYFPPREIFVYACECIENGDLIMITKQGIRIFTIIRPAKKIRMRYFWNNDSWRGAWKYSKRGVTNDEDEKGFYFEDARQDLRRYDQLPPLDITRIIELYETFYITEENSRIWPFKELLRNYLHDTSTLAKYGKRILYKAIDAKKGNIVELICDLCINFLEMNSDNFYLLKIIVKCLPKLQQNYPEIVAEFMAKSSMILDHQCFIAINSEQTTLHGYARDVMIYEKNTYWDHYHNIQSVYYKLFYFIKNIIDTISGDDEEENFGTPVVVFLIPLYKFSSYSPTFNFVKDIYQPKSNPFTETYYPAFYNEWSAEALLNFKWHTYGKFYYYAIWGWFNVYLLIFAVGTTTADETLSKEVRSTLLVATIVIGFIFFANEIRDLIWRPRKYLRNFWNLFDCGAYLFPIATSIYWLKTGQRPPLWLPTIANLLVDIKFLLFFGVFESFGRYFAIILGVAKHVFSFVMILFFIIISFAHAFYILLRPREQYSLDIPTVNGDNNNPWSLTDRFYQMNPDGTYGTGPVLVKQPQSSTNMFAHPQTSLLAMYLFLTGDPSSLSSFSYVDYSTLALLSTAFSFFIIVYLMNLFIGLLNNAIDVNSGHANYLIEKSRIIAEIELFYLIPHQRRWRTWFPDVIYYEVPVDEVRKKIHLIDTTQSSSAYSPILSSRLRDIVDMPKSYNQQQQDLLSQFETIKHFLKKINDDGLHRQFSIPNIGTFKREKTGTMGTIGSIGTRDIKMYSSGED